MQLSPEELARILALRKNQGKDGGLQNKWKNTFSFDEIVKDPNDEPKSMQKTKRYLLAKYKVKFKKHILIKLDKEKVC